MKGYITAMGYMGYVEGRYLLFCSEADYMDYIRELQKWTHLPKRHKKGKHYENLYM